MYWFTNNLLSIAQVRLLSLNYVKNLFGFATQRKGITMEGPVERMQTREAMRIRKLKEKKYVTFISFKLNSIYHKSRPSGEMDGPLQ